MTGSRKDSGRARGADGMVALRKKQLSQVNEILAILESRRQEFNQKMNQYKLLDSVTKGLYEEIDKLAKKAPADNITELMLEQVNDVIRETRELVKDDPYIQRLKEFIAAGDLPEHRDVVVILRQLRQGLERFRTSTDFTSDLLGRGISEARLLQKALEIYVGGVRFVGRERLEEARFPSYELNKSPWLNSWGEQEFRWDLLDETDIPTHFQVVLEDKEDYGN